MNTRKQFTLIDGVFAMPKTAFKNLLKQALLVNADKKRLRDFMLIDDEYLVVEDKGRFVELVDCSPYITDSLIESCYEKKVKLQQEINNSRDVVDAGDLGILLGELHIYQTFLNKAKYQHINLGLCWNIKE